MAYGERLHQRAWNRTKEIHGNARDWIRGREITPGITNFFLILVFALWVIDLGTGYVGTQLDGSFGSFDSILNAFLIIARTAPFMFFVTLLIINQILKKEFNLPIIITRAFIIFMSIYLMINGTILAQIHFFIGIMIWLLVLKPSFPSGLTADGIFIGVVLIEIFGTYYLINQFTTISEINPFLDLFLHFPFWFMIIMLNPYIPKSKVWYFAFVGMLFLVFFNQSYAQTTDPMRDVVNPELLSDTIDMATNAYNNIKKMGKDIGKNIKRGIDIQIEKATGGYYQGKVEENVAEPLGVYLENIMAAETVFYEDEKVMLWGTLRARTLDEEKTITVKLRCCADCDEDDPGDTGTIMPPRMRSFEVELFDEEDFSCEFNEGELETGHHEVRLLAEFDFSTMAYLKTYFMDNEKRKALLRQNIDILDEYGITDKNPVTVFTNGPVGIGSGRGSDSTLRTLPIGVYNDKIYALGITFENQWEGKIKEIKNLVLELPKGMEVTYCKFGEKKGKGEDTEDGFKRYTIELSDEFEDIETFKSMICNLKIVNTEDLLAKTPITTRYYRIEAEYDYELETEFTVDIEESPLRKGGGLTGAKDIPPSLTDEIAETILYAAEKEDVKRDLFFAIGEQESNFNPKAPKSDKGCVGMYQINPNSVYICESMGIDEIKDVEGEENVEENIQCAAIILRHYYDTLPGGEYYYKHKDENYPGWEGATRLYVGKGPEHPEFVEQVWKKMPKYTTWLSDQGISKTDLLT